MTEKIDSKYFKQDYKNPTYVFHGSKNMYDKLIPQQAYDVASNKENERNAVFASSVFKGAVPYCIKGRGNYDCSIGYTIEDLTMKISYGTIPEDEYGYIHVCDAKDFIKIGKGESCQYISYKEIKPIEIIKIYYKDFKDCFVYIEAEDNEKCIVNKK